MNIDKPNLRTSLESDFIAGSTPAATTKGQTITQYITFLLSSIVAHTLALWLGIFASGLILGKAGGAEALSTAIVVCVPFFVAGFYVARSGDKHYLLNATLGGMVTVIGFGITIAFYMDNDFSGLAGASWALGFSVFSLIGSIIGKLITRQPAAINETKK